ncbi:MAG: lactate racemase domain-containing protein [Sedimentisphaerales bacterium]|nr:lactate racemase domain-containing protein [Sedimentisphaerales bacterium]
MIIERQTTEGFLDIADARVAVEEFFKQNDCTDKKILLIIPDNTRSGPVGDIFKIIFDCIGHNAVALDCLIALGTHQPMTDDQICTRLEITPQQKNEKYAKVKFFNHQWEKPDTFTSIGKISADQIQQITSGLFHEDVDVAVNKLIFDYDQFFILGPVFPHEVVGFSGGHKYIFPGIAGAEIINFFHWLGAVITNPKINGQIDTPTRQIVEKAASFITVPHHLFALVALDNKLKGLFLGDTFSAWQKAAQLSQKVHITYVQKTYKTVLGIAPEMYDDLWTAGKVMYKLEPVVADGGTLIIYAPHITEVSYTHGAVIDKIGYHTRDYFLKQMDKFADIPRGVLAHSTHVKGIGTYIDGIEKPRINVVLATKIPENLCKKINLTYANPDKINITEYENDQQALVVHHAGEVLYRLADGTVPAVPDLPKRFERTNKNGKS